MSDLAQLQAIMSAGLLDAAVAAPKGLTGPGGNAAARFDIYRNTTQISLGDALAANFPVTTALVDRRFFGFLAHAYIRLQPPREPRLSCYGAALPSFIARFEPCKAHPYLADVARLEWALVEASGEATSSPIAHTALNALKGSATPMRLHLQSSMRLLVLRWPAIEVWRAHQPGAPGEPVKISRRPRFVEVKRLGRGVAMNEMAHARFVFRHVLSRGGTLEQAALRALNRDCFFDLVSELIALFREELVVGLDIIPQTVGDHP